MKDNKTTHKTTKVEAVYDAIIRKSIKIKRQSPESEPTFEIYMSSEFFYESLIEVSGKVSSISYEFFSQSTISGCKVWRVPLIGLGREHEHPPFRIVLVNDEYVASGSDL